MRSCKINKKGEYKKNINYKKGKGTKIIKYLLSNLTKFTQIVQTIYYFIIKASNKNIGQHKITTEIYHKITYLIYMILWLNDEKEMLNSDSIQQMCLELCYIHYKFTINLIITLQYAGILESNTLYQIINNINVIAYGYDYNIQIKDIYFDKNENLLNTAYIFSNLNQRQVQLKLVFYKFYETSLSILFEVPNIQIESKFYLQMLKFQLETSISLVLSFQDYYPKFIFYFRLARDPEIISLMQQCIVIVISLNQDPQIIKQLFETLSQHQSTILMNDLDDLQLDAYDQDEIKQTYKMANLSLHRIPLLQCNYSLLIQLVDDKDYYIKVFKIIIEIFQLVYQKIIKSPLFLRRHIISLDAFSPNPISILEGKMRIKIVISENESSKLQDLDQMKLGLFLDNFEYAEKLTIFTLYFSKNQEIQFATCKLKKFIIIYKEDEFYQEQDYLTNLDLTSWFNIDFQLKNNQNLMIQINEQNLIFQVQQQDNQQLQFSKFIFGVKMNDQLQETNEDFNNSIELLDQYSFEGIVSEFYLIINNSKIQFEQIKKSNSKRQTLKFINQEVLNQNQLKFDQLFSISPVMQNECTICCQNVYKLDIKKGTNFIQKCGGFNIFNMILDLLYTVCENINARDSEKIIILVLKIFQENILMYDSKVNSFFKSQNLQNIEENCKRWININQMISNEFIIQLLSIYTKLQNEQESFLFLVTIIKILDNKFTTFDQIKLISTSRIIQKLTTPQCLRKFMNIQLYYESRYLFAQVSMEISQAFLKIEEKNLFSYSLFKCIQYQGVVMIPQINPITIFFNLLVSQKCFNLFTLDILQIIDILIEDRMKQKINIRIEEETTLNSFKIKIFQILKKQQKQFRSNQSFIYEFETIDKLYELTFSIYLSLVQQLRYNSKENRELDSLQIYFDYFLKKRIEVGSQLISKVLTLINQFEEDALLIKLLLRFQSQLILNLLIKESVKITIIIWYLDIFKNAALKKQSLNILILNLLKLSNFPLLMKQLMTISLENKQKSLDLFTYLIIYLIEVYPNLTSELLYEVHIKSQILSNNSFNSYLQVVYHTTISFYALKQVQQFQGKEDESKLVNIIVLYMHIEQCIGEISNLQIVDWNNYSQIMEKGLDLFNYLGILFYDHDYFIPNFEDTFNLEQIKEDHHKLKKQNNKILPNGGIKRLMQQLIAPFVKIPQMIKPIRNYLSKNKYSIEGRIDSQSYQRIQQFIDQEFSVYLFITKKQYRQQLAIMLHNADNNLGRMRIKEKGSKLVKHSKFYKLLVYYALFENNSLNENQIDKQNLKHQDELQEILGLCKLTKIMDWQNVDPNQIQCFFHQHKESQGQILKAFNKLNTLKLQAQSNQKSIIGTHDLSQIDLSNNQLASSIRVSIFMDIIIYYQLIHKFWVLYPIIMDPQEKQKTQSKLLEYLKSNSLTQFEYTQKENQRTHKVYPNLTSELLYEVHIKSQILSNNSFNSYLQVVYHTTISFYALKQVQQFQGKEDESKLVNIIVLYMHIEQCIGEISNLQIVDWNNYSQIMEKGLDLFNYLGILFYDHDYFIPNFEDTFNLEQIKEDHHKLKKQNNKILPNGGIKRLMQQLIAPFVKIPQMIKPIRNYLSKNKYSIEGRIDSQSYQRIQQFIDQEFSVYLFITKKQYRQQLAIMLHNADNNLGRMRIKEKGSKLVKHSKFYKLLVYYALFENNSLNENQIDKQNLKHQDELQEILGLCKLTKIMDWQNVDPNQIQCFFHQHKESQGQILKAFNKLNTLKLQAQSNQKSIIGTHDLSQIDLSNNQLASSIRVSIFMDIIIYYQLIHKFWVLYPIIMDPQEKQKTQSKLLEYLKSNSLTQFEYTQKENQRTHSTVEDQRQQLFSCQVEDQLQLLLQKLNNFIFDKKFNFKVFETRQWKWVVDLQDFTRKQPFLQITKIKQLYCSQEERDNQFDQQQFYQTQIRSSIKKEQVIQNKVNNAIINLQKGSPENNQVGTTRYNCEYITYQGAYQGMLIFNEINYSIQFQQQELESEEIFSSSQVIQTTQDMFLEITLDRIVNVHPRRFLLMEIAIEIFIDRQNYFFNLFKNQEQQLLMQEFRKKKVQVIDPKQEFKKMNYQEKWVEGQLSNFHYLMLVNIFSGRTCNDLSQYFVFPWVIQNYKSNKIAFSSIEGSDTLRDLKLPIGAIVQNPEQIIKDYKEREITSSNGNYQHKHHYSNAQTVLKYLIRLNPSKLIEEISMSDRLFSSIENLWDNSIKYDNKELIPEFYYMPEFLRNINLLPFETLQQQSRIPVVELPKWVKTQTAEEFVYIMRLALESDKVSTELNHWIDLIFGNKNNGQNAVDNANMFHYLTYQENLNTLLNQINDNLAIQSYLTKIQDIGQTPKQLFQKNHKKRKYGLQVFTNEIPYFCNNLKKNNKLYVFKQFEEMKEQCKSQILGFYPYSKKCIYILKSNDETYNHLTLLETKHFQDYLDFYPQIELKQKVQLPELKIDGCNPQNIFSFIYEQQFDFGDGYDSQYYSVFEGKQNYNLYLCLVGFLDDNIKIYDLRNNMKKLKINFPSQDLKRQKRASCIRYHAASKILAIGSLDGLLQLFQIQFNQQLEVKAVFTKQLENGILCIDLTDLLILTVDYKNIANLLSLEGNVLLTIYIDNSDKFWQCCIQMYFLVFKSVKSQIYIFTMNGEQYLQTVNLLDRTSSKNILFTTPFSSKFLLYSLNQNGEENWPQFVPVIHYIDIFDLKLKGMSNFNSLLVNNQIVVNKGNLKGSGISALHISFMRCKIDKQKKIKHIYLIAVDNQILQYMDEHYDYLTMLRYKLKQGGV
ncbi:unnamed protein product [Paramecium octaurelia]|uniref:Uncharacterized protein n=1 Tax=Paramecium octaurelia TaxID=43137 RepID=A0A8S1UXL2_PAROT|nr:unnamed protein product [Paramecium octaurelia]